ncbi:MAG: helix-turn-helix domain-containing protein [Thiogranum sp.]|nr:helix-turn-helix domain-containing protein [Thiogranum sp.]
MLTPAQAAEQLGVAVKTLKKWRWKGVGPRFERLGHKTVRYSEAAVAAFARSEPGAGVRPKIGRPKKNRSGAENPPPQSLY